MVFSSLKVLLKSLFFSWSLWVCSLLCLHSFSFVLCFFTLLRILYAISLQLFFPIFLRLVSVILHICRLYAIFLPFLRFHWCSFTLYSRSLASARLLCILLDSFNLFTAFLASPKLLWLLLRLLVCFFPFLSWLWSTSHLFTAYFFLTFLKLMWVFWGCSRLSSRFLAFQQLLFFLLGESLPTF